jgi:hypothetical protein
LKVGDTAWGGSLVPSPTGNDAKDRQTEAYISDQNALVGLPRELRWFSPCIACQREA